MTVQTQTIDYLHEGTLLEGYFAYKGGTNTPQPTILIAHAWEGRDDFVCEKARKLAEFGYNAFALDMYGKGVLGSNAEENGKLMQPFLDNRLLLQQRMHAGMQAASELPQVDPARIAVIGYCFGGLCALDLARSGAKLKGAVSFHGLLNPPGNTKGARIDTKILILHGDKDPLVPRDLVVACEQEFSSAGADWQLYTYGAAMHSFTNPHAKNAATGLLYNADADRRSWQALLNFLGELFG